VAGNAENWKREVRQVMSRRRRSFPSSETVVSKKEARQVMGNVCDVKGRKKLEVWKAPIYTQECGVTTPRQPADWQIIHSHCVSIYSALN
jgi:hypothetical protein